MNEVCPLCKKESLVEEKRNSLPNYSNQIYVYCVKCKSGWMKLVEVYKEVYL